MRRANGRRDRKKSSPSDGRGNVNSQFANALKNDNFAVF
jgi:hypothetical protein